MQKTTEKQYKIRPLKIGERVEAFDCGDADLNDFILNEAHLYREELLAVTYVMEERESGKVIAYFCLINDKVSLSEFEDKTEFNRFRRKRFINEKRLKSYPAVKIGRFGVDISAHGLRIGSQLISFIKYFFAGKNKTGCRFLTVDAYIDAIPFYRKNEFEELTVFDKEDKHTRALIFDLKELKKKEAGYGQTD